MATIMFLPNEIILIILEKLSIKDIEYFSSTCKTFRQIEWGNILWIKKFYQRWPTMKNVYDKMKSEDLQQIDFKKELKENAKFAKKMWEFVHYLFMDNSNDDIKKDLLLDFLYSNAGSTNYFLLLDEFKRIFAQSAREPGHDLTRRFNSRFIFRLIRHSRTRFKYLKFINKPKEQQFLEQLVTIVVQWFTPLQHVSYSRIQALLDKIAQQVLQTLRKECPKHPILTVANEHYIYWKTNNINYSYWNYKEILPISFITERIIFSQTNFQTLNQLWLTHQNQDAYNISEGSEKLFLLTIYHSVLRRFGIYSLLIGGCLLQIFWKPIDNNGLGYYSIGLQSGRFFLVPNHRSIDKRCHYKTITKLVDHLEKELQTLHPGEINMLSCMLLRQYINITDVMMWFCDFTIPKKNLWKKDRQN
ncbi:uncharacterized protein LOC114935311 [Nylanderia fulva]|uniref:uncharacterized protein LOC114935311 n=1 Tax=Nylanderia fulva TaxID=613905 RepID=UPI0010FBA9C1|nr:uncharacterized protein LOC114935311 [Nylanderia fulva]